MMRQTANFSNGEFDDFQVLEMPYRSASPKLRPPQGKERMMNADEIPDVVSELAMTIILPRKIDGLKEVEDPLVTGNASKLVDPAIVSGRGSDSEIPNRIEFLAQ